MTKSKIY